MTEPARDKVAVIDSNESWTDWRDYAPAAKKEQAPAPEQVAEAPKQEENKAPASARPQDVPWWERDDEDGFGYGAGYGHAPAYKPYAPTVYVPTRNGELPVLIGGHLYEIIGGPYEATTREFKDSLEFFGVKLDPHCSLPCTLELPIVDFSTPDPGLLRQAIHKTLRALVDGKTVYVGCKGGQGRTGLFMACLLKLVGVKKPIAYARYMYYPRAVETAAQEQFVQSFKIWPSLPFLIWLKLKLALTA